MFRLSVKDLLNGLVVAVLAPLFLSITTVLGVVIMGPSFDVFTVDWAALGKSLLNTSIVVSYGAFTGYLTKNFFSSKDSGFANLIPNKK